MMKVRLWKGGWLLLKPMPFYCFSGWSQCFFDNKTKRERLFDDPPYTSFTMIMLISDLNHTIICMWSRMFYKPSHNGLFVWHS